MKRSFLLAMLLAAVVPFTHAATVYDNFNHPQWTVIKVGAGPNVHEANQRLEVAFPVRATVPPGGDYFMGGYQSTCLLHGDFDVRVGYALVRFPPLNGVRVGLSFDGFSVERISFSRSEGFTDGDFYLTDGGHGIISTPTQDRWGKLRLIRQNGVISGYYFDATSKTWQFIGSSSITTDDAPFRIATWSHDWAFADKFTKVAFDDVILDAGTLVGPRCSITP
jgi:hypothetical protein